MKSTSRLTVAVTATIAACTGLCGCPGHSKPGGNPGSQVIERYEQIDKFQDQLAKRASDRLGATSDFSIHVTGGLPDIGELIRPSGTIPINDEACVPERKPVSKPLLNVFPNYSLTSGLAVDFGLDDSVISEIAQFGVNIQSKREVKVQINDTSFATLTDDALHALTSRPSCDAAIRPGTTVWLVRGYISGKRTFSVVDTNSSKVTAKITKLGSFEITPGSSVESLDISDSTPTGFLIIVSEITKPTVAGPASITAPQTPAGGGRVYIQRDRADGSDAANQVSQGLKADSFSVSSGIERIASNKMPTKAQVRFFNKSDKVQAGRALKVLQEQFPDAILKEVDLPAPQNQLEVWLPRVPGG